jgi:ribonuclease HI
MMIYCDGSYNQYTGDASVGVTYYNISKRVNASNSFEAELLAIYQALLICKCGTTIVTDCKNLQEILCNYVPRQSPYPLSKVYSLMKFKKCDVVYMPRTNPGMKKADRLATQVGGAE